MNHSQHAIQFTEKWIRFGIPLTLIATSMVAQQVFILPFTYLQILAIIKIAFFIILTFESGRYLVIKVRRIIPGIHQTSRRTVISYCCALINCFLFITLSTWIGKIHTLNGTLFLQESLINFMQCLWFAFLIVTPCELFYFHELLIQNEKERRRLLDLSTQSELNALRSHVNPHFLFNMLNTISSMVVKNPFKAEEMIVEMSSVYRYLLKNNRYNLATLSSELEFLNSNLLLLEARFPYCFEIKINIPDRFLSLFLPPLSLQLLIENVVKHNILTPENPVEIALETDDSHSLIVSNKIVKKKTVPHSTGTGLSTLISRYRLLTDQQVIISEEGALFVVRLPLLKNNSNEGFNY